jgi:cupin 2 domain-containing protein
MTNNLLAHIPSELPDELIQTLLTADSVRIERIISYGHASPPGFWYCQPEHEWVLIVQGAAHLKVIAENGTEQTIELNRGDYYHFPAQQRHRVDWTTPAEPTIWLAVFYGGKIDGNEKALRETDLRRVGG